MVIALGVLACSTAIVAVTGCKDINEPNTVSAGDEVVATGTVQASMTTDASGSAWASGTTSGGAAPAKPWPDKVGTFAGNTSAPVWYPTTVPSSMKRVSLDVIEMEKGTGLVCDMVFTDGKKVIQFTQGSPKTRDWDPVPVSDVPWGTETASLVKQDQLDPASPQMIVYDKGGNFAELTGDVSIDVLKAVAAGMVLVR